MDGVSALCIHEVSRLGAVLTEPLLFTGASSCHKSDRSNNHYVNICPLTYIKIAQTYSQGLPQKKCVIPMLRFMQVHVSLGRVSSLI